MCELRRAGDCYDPTVQTIQILGLEGIRYRTRIRDVAAAMLSKPQGSPARLVEEGAAGSRKTRYRSVGGAGKPQQVPSAANTAITGVPSAGVVPGLGLEPRF